ncbi:unnamed protein product [Owenia fusiformis]|uniref:Acyl-CoA thioesterase II n=1 Tax=Owenia fusiformis TaxID=6347 RepID=A0A8S4Q490_OWEFU|nr:unnamed protein product [Owenia fusiformis]
MATYNKRRYLKDEILTLEKIDENTYRADSDNLWHPAGARAVYGGQIYGQGLYAAIKTLNNQALLAHSMHCYFVRAGNPHKPITYHVEHIRDGASFCTRRVVAEQHGKTIVIMQCSFHKPEVGKLNHQTEMPKVPPPEKVMSIQEIMHNILKDNKLPEKKAYYFKERLKAYNDELPLEVKPVDIEKFLKLKKTEPSSQLWIRAKDNLENASCNMHNTVVAWLTDWSPLGTALQPDTDFNVGLWASLDHCVWFHEPMRADQWMLMQFDSPKAGGGRAITFGKLWSQDGRLVASMSQEGLLRSKI